MSQAQFLANRLKEVCLDGKFIANTNIKDLIESITCSQANERVKSLNTIALLTYHLKLLSERNIRIFKDGYFRNS